MQTAGFPERADRLIRAALLASFGAIALASAVVHSGVPDEVAVHVPAGVLFLETGRFAGGLGNPPLGQLWVGWPAALDADYVPFDTAGLLGPRVAVIALALAGSLVLHGFACRLVGPTAALGGLFFLATSPTFAAHASLATLDVPIAVCALVAVTRAHRASADGGLRSFAALGLALGAACATKVQGLALVPLVAAQIALAPGAVWRNGAEQRAATLRGALLSLGVGFVVLHAAYGFGPLLRGQLLPEAFLAATSAKAEHGTSVGHHAYLLGEYSTAGWWSYFPIALAVKTPLVALLAFAIGAAGLVRSRTLAVWLGLPIVLFFGLAVTSRVNIGIRHLLPLYPFAFAVAGLGLAQVASRARLAAIVLVSVQLGEAFWTAPHGLAYFNVFGGGSAGGHRVLLDSNYDWGQHDGALRDYLAGQPAGGPVEIDPDPLVPRAGRIVVGASALHGLLGSGEAAYAWLRAREPTARISHTWFEYRILPDELGDRVGAAPSRRQHPARIELAKHVLRATRHPEVGAQPRLALDVAVACNAVLEYACALDHARAVLGMRPAHRGAFWLASEITARRRLGVLLFEGREYLDGFRPLAPADAWLSVEALRAAAATAGATSEVARLHRGLGDARFGERDWSAALLHWRRAHALAPSEGNIEYQLGWLLATCPDADCRDGAAALELAQRHGEQREWSAAAQFDLLAAALAELGRFEQAREAAQRALAMAQGRAARSAIQARIEGYAAGRPHRLALPPE
jgi:tetratricopeptide (TPR) repeat protein